MNQDNDTPADVTASADSDQPRTQEFPGVMLEDLPLPLQEACKRAGWSRLTPVQEKAIPYLLKGKDMMVQARTGSGKTGAFVLPLLDKLDSSAVNCQALVLVPTRELCVQVAEEARKLCGDSGMRVAAVYGGVGYRDQIEAFKQGAHIVVGTPGRVLDHLLKRAFNLDDLRYLVFDEADRMLSVGFYPDMKEMQRYLPRKLQGAYMFSATYPQSVIRLGDEFLRKPEMLSLSGKQMHVAESLHLYCEVPQMGRERMLIRIIEMENPSSGIIFCNTKSNVHYVSEVLKQHGFDAEEISSDLNQNKREVVLRRIREGKLRFLVATDVAARGIDIQELSHVFLYEPPEDPESYIHRAGRTGRAGASGTVITLVDFVQKGEMLKLASRYSVPMQELALPEEGDVVGVIEERLTTMLESEMRKLSHVQQERVRRFLPSAKKLAEDEDAHQLLAMLLDNLYQRSLISKPEEPEGQKQTQKATQRKRKRKPRKGNSRKPATGANDQKQNS